MDRPIDLALIIYVHAVVGFGVYVCYRAFHRLRARITALELRRPDRGRRFEDLVVSAAQDFDADRPPGSGVLGLIQTSPIDRATPDTAFTTPEAEFLRRLDRLRTAETKPPRTDGPRS